MADDTQSKAAPKWMFWAGCVMSAIPVLMLLMSAGFKLAESPQAVEGFAKMGFPDGISIPLGIVEAACTVLYVIPQTSVLGAILVTGYLGGATVVHVRASEPFIIPVALGVLAWGGLFLRDPRIRALLPLRR